MRDRSPRYYEGWWIGCNTFNVEGEYEEPVEPFEPFERGLWDGLRFNRQLRAALIHRRDGLLPDVLWDLVQVAAPCDEEFKEMVRRALDDADTAEKGSAATAHDRWPTGRVIEEANVDVDDAIMGRDVGMAELAVRVAAAEHMLSRCETCEKTNPPPPPRPRLGPRRRGPGRV
jgi:hypothetical protein